MRYLSLFSGAGGLRQPKIVVAPVLTPNRPEKRQNGRRMKEDGEPMFTLTGQDVHGVAIMDLYNHKEHTDRCPALTEPHHNSIRVKITKEEPVMNTLTEAVGNRSDELLGASGPVSNIYKTTTQIRRLTPVECERLQAFPDLWTAKGIDDRGNEVEISDSQRYKMMGNAVSICVVKAIVERMPR